MTLPALLTYVLTQLFCKPKVKHTKSLFTYRHASFKKILVTLYPIITKFRSQVKYIQIIHISRGVLWCGGGGCLCTQSSWTEDSTTPYMPVVYFLVKGQDFCFQRKVRASLFGFLKRMLGLGLAANEKKKTKVNLHTKSGYNQINFSLTHTHTLLIFLMCV